MRKQIKVKNSEVVAAEVVTFNFVEFLAKMTGDDSWIETEGPDSGVGTDYWFTNCDGDNAYINVDQCSMTVMINDETVYEGSSEVAEVAEA